MQPRRSRARRRRRRSRRRRRRSSRPAQRQPPRLLQPLLAGKADAVFGSRFLVAGERRVLYYWHSLANHILTTACNMAADLNLTDMETCYKAFRLSLARSIPIRSNRFGIEPEITGEWRAGDVRHVFASTGHAADVLGFRAAEDFEAGMEEFASAPLRA